MCNFFSLISDGNGKILYFDSEIRKKIINGDLDYETDSHSSIAAYYKLNEDRFNKWEYNVFTKELKEDQINAKNNDHATVLYKCQNLDFKTVVPELRLRTIFNPRSVDNALTDGDILLVKRWASVWDSVGASVWDSAGDSAGDSVRALVRDSVWDSVWASVRALVWDSAGDSVRALVRDSVWDSVWAITGSFFELSEWKYVCHEKGEYPFQCAVDLWNRGFVCTFIGDKINIHAGKDMKIIKTITK